MNHQQIQYPVRINRYLFLTGVCSRREADRLIERGEVFLNGKTAVLGAQVQEGDTVSLSSEAREKTTNYRYYLYNKPVGIVSHNPQEGEQSVEDVSGLGKDVYPIGRLDKASSGLMLLSDDGRIVDALLNPKHAHEREYTVRVDKRITDSALSRMERGVRIESGENEFITTKPARIERISADTFSITLTEGKKHQIRRMCAALGYSVVTLHRTRIEHLEIGTLAENESRELTDTEREQLLLATVGTAA